MNIFFDGKIFAYQKQGGISRLNFELIKSLQRFADVDKMFYRGAHIDQYPFKKEWFTKYWGVKKPDFLKGRAVNFLDNVAMNMAYNTAADQKTIFHSLYYRIPKNPKGPVVVSAYDLIQELFDKEKSEKTIRFKKQAFVKANVIAAISQSTKNDICNLYSINPEKIIVAYPGVSQIFFENEALPLSKSRPYMLYVGARNYVYKNFDALLTTFIDKKYFLDFDLVIVGPEKEIASVHKERIKNTQGQGSWLRQEFCDDQKLSSLYKNAAVFIYPSLYEGFGIPPLEAMAAGCPVVASNASSIPEVVGDAGLLFNPKDPSDLAKNIDAILNDNTLAQALIQKGKARANQFTWDKMADSIYKGYQSI